MMRETAKRFLPTVIAGAGLLMGTAVEVQAQDGGGGFFAGFKFGGAEQEPEKTWAERYPYLVGLEPGGFPVRELTPGEAPNPFAMSVEKPVFDPDPGPTEDATEKIQARARESVRNAVQKAFEEEPISGMVRMSTGTVFLREGRTFGLNENFTVPLTDLADLDPLDLELRITEVGERTFRVAYVLPFGGEDELKDIELPEGLWENPFHAAAPEAWQR